MAERKTEGQDLQVVRETLPSTTFAKLQELTRHGYALAAEPGAPAGQLLLRHPAGPDLILHEDGRLDVSPRQQGKPRPAGVLKTARRIYWGRGCLFLTGLAVVTFVSFMLFVAITSN